MASKYNVGSDKEKRTHDGIVFDSVMEMRYYRDVLCPLVESGDIVNVELQKQYELQPKFVHDGKTVRAITYVADFEVSYKDGHREVVDVKGYPTQVAQIKKKMFWYCYPHIQYKWLCYVKKFGGWCDYEYVKKKRREQKANKKKECEV